MMIYTELTKKAMQIAYAAHKEQTDKSGLPYIFHPYHIAEQMTDEISVCVALLHDVVEDTDVTFEDLAIQGITETVTEVLKLLTHDSSVLYMDYIQKIKDSGNQTAVAVKLADLRHNSDESRLSSIDEKTAARLKKYKAAIEILEGCGQEKIYTIDEIARLYILVTTDWYSIYSIRDYFDGMISKYMFQHIRDTGGKTENNPFYSEVRKLIQLNGMLRDIFNNKELTQEQKDIQLKETVFNLHILYTKLMNEIGR